MKTTLVGKVDFRFIDKPGATILKQGYEKPRRTHGMKSRRTATHLWEMEKRRWLAVYSVILLTTMLLNSGCERAKPIRISCFPLASAHRWMETICCDVLNHGFRSMGEDDLLPFPLEWTAAGVESDSVSDTSYLLRYSRRVGLDYAVFISGRSVSTDRIAIDFKMVWVNETRTLLDTAVVVVLPFTGDPFLPIAEKIVGLISRRYGDAVPSDITTRSDIRDFGEGRWYGYIGDPENAERAYRRALLKDSSHVSTGTHLASVLMDQMVSRRLHGQYTEELIVEAGRLLRSISERDSSNALCHRLLGRLYIYTEQWNKAEQELKTALSLDPMDCYTYWNLTRLHPSRYRDMGFNNKRDLLRRAIRLNPGFTRAWIDLGNQYYFQLQHRKAEKIYNRILEIYPASLDALLALGKLYTLQNDVLNIIRVYQRVLEIDSRNGDAYYNLGVAYYNDEKEDEAVRFFKRAIEIDGHVESTYYLGVIHAKRGDREKAVEYLRERIRLKMGPDDPFAQQAREILYDLLHTPE